MPGNGAGTEVPLERVDCPLCGACDEEFLFEARDRLHGLPGSFPLVRCRRCRMIYLNPRPTREGMARYYPDDYFTHREAGTRPKNTLARRVRYRVLRRYYGYPARDGSRRLGSLGRILALPALLYFKLDRRNSLVMPFQGEGRFLDVGCGDGRLLFDMREGGWSVAGVEIDAGLARRLSAEMGLSVHAGEIEDCPFDAGSFDVIHMSHVIEHLRDPRRSLSRIHELLKPGGRLYLRLPDFDSFCAQRFKDQWFALDAPRHLLTFTKHTVKAMLTRTGFAVEYVKQDRNFRGLRRTLQCLDPGSRGFFADLLRIKPVMKAAEEVIRLLRRGDAIIVCAGKS